MNLKPTLFAIAAAAAMSAHATTITFDDLASGTILSNQYAGLGVTFSANAFTGSNSNSTSQGWATNSGMTVTATDVGSLGTPLLTSGNLLHSFGDWLGENGDPSFLISFAAPIKSISIDFAGVGTPGDSAIYVFNGSTLLGTVLGTSVACTPTCQFTLSYSAPSITSVAVAPGSYGDWVGIDNVVFAAAVPEPQTWAMLLLGVGVIGAAKRRSSRT